MPPDSGPACVDAVVIGAGDNGLVAAAVLADAGWGGWSARFRGQNSRFSRDKARRRTFNSFAISQELVMSCISSWQMRSSSC
jgi:hypothetical protein